MAREICDDKSKNDIVVLSAGFCYSDVSSGNSAMQTHLMNQIQSLVTESTTEFCQPEFTTALPETGTENLIVGTESAHWQENRLVVIDDSSLRCVFPCEGNERPSQGLSLSLSSTNPTSIGLQSFELRQTCHGSDINQHDDMRFIGSSSSRDGFFVKPASLHHQGQFQVRNSKYLGPAQEVLNEFCSLGNKQIDALKQKLPNHDDENGSSSSMKQSLLHSLDFMELQKRKIKLLSMLEEVDVAARTRTF